MERRSARADTFVSLDDTDRSIVAALQADARVRTSELARRVALSAPAVAERLRRLEDGGVISYRTEVNPAALGYPICALVRISPHSLGLPRIPEIARATPEVTECYRVTGEDCYVLKLHLRSMDDLEGILDRFTEHGRTTTSIIHSVPVPAVRSRSARTPRRRPDRRGRHDGTDGGDKHGTVRWPAGARRGDLRGLVQPQPACPVRRAQPARSGQPDARGPGRPGARGVRGPAPAEARPGGPSCATSPSSARAGAGGPAASSGPSCSGNSPSAAGLPESSSRWKTRPGRPAMPPRACSGAGASPSGPRSGPGCSRYRITSCPTTPAPVPSRCC